MIDLLLQNSLLLLFVVAALGYVIGRIKIRGFSLGVSAVLFVGLFFGALHPDIETAGDHLPVGPGVVRVHDRPEQRPRFFRRVQA